jgi:hypothetical protein
MDDGMNYDKIKELAEQAGIQEDLVDHLKDEVEVLTYIARPQDIQKFAELIVRECIKCIQLTTARDPQHTVQYKQSVGHLHRIREHFGIEE